MRRSNPLERAFQVLDIVACADREMPLVEIVNAAGLPPSTTFRLTSNLVDCGMLAFDPNRKVYALGSRARRLAFFLRGHHEISELALPVLETLANHVGETTFVVRRGEDGLRLLRYKVPEVGAQAFIHPGFNFPRHATATGKVIHAFGGTDPVGEDAELERYQDATITDPAVLEKVYAAIREQGYAENISELDHDVYSVAAPILVHGEAVGALAIVAPRERILEKEVMPLGDVIAELCEQARVLTRLLEQVPAPR